MKCIIVFEDISPSRVFMKFMSDERLLAETDDAYQNFSGNGIYGR